MTLFLISILAGVLTVLAPCILPLLPVIVGSSVGSRSRLTPYIVIGSLALSILLFTYILKASTALLAIPDSAWSYLSGGILILFGLFLLFPQLWEMLPGTQRANTTANQLVGRGYQKKSFWGDVLIGAALGPVFSSCSPTYFVILATVLPASFFLGTLYLLTYIAGLVLVLLLIAVLGQRLTKRLQFAADSRSLLKRGIGGLFLLVGIFIMTGYDKKVETWVLENGYIDGVLQFEQDLLDETETDADADNEAADATIDIPRALARDFPDTDFTRADSALENAISGGPAKDGIPAIDQPSFVPLASVSRADDVQAIVLHNENETKVYPYNILIWHEIVNDTFDDTPVAITFCPLCGSAIVFNRTLPDGTVSTFGVSGSLLESNMIMYDRKTENLWQQSTGKTLAGSWHPATLEHEPFQLLTLGDIRATYPDAQVLSEDTGQQRNYGRNPYAGYESSDDFIFAPSDLDTSFDPKTIMAVFVSGDTVFAAPWLDLRAAGSVDITHNNTTYSLTVTDTGELTIRDAAGTTYPFYFEMWFSVAVQNEANLEVIIP